MIALPNVAWQAHYGFPMMELLRNGQNGKNVIPSPGLYALQELLITNPLLASAWLAGLFWLLFAPRFRFLAYAYIVLIAEMLGLHGKHYYPANVYPILIAAGGVAFEAWTGRLRLLRGPVLAYAFLAGLLMLPDVLPVLPEATFVEAIMREIVADARLCGVAVTDDIIARMLSNTEKMTPYRTSMKIDYDDHRPLEIEAIFGNPLRAVQRAPSRLLPGPRILPFRRCNRG